MAVATMKAQTEVTAGIMRGKDYGVTYMLPQTEIIINVETTKHTYTPDMPNNSYAWTMYRPSQAAIGVSIIFQ